jgi:hypothetical protein
MANASRACRWHSSSIYEVGDLSVCPDHRRESRPKERKDALSRSALKLAVRLQTTLNSNREGIANTETLCIFAIELCQGLTAVRK